MMERDVEVVAVKGRLIRVQFRRQSSCDSCSSNEQCGSGQLSKAVNRRLDVLDMHCDQAVAVGDFVRVGITEQSLVRGTLILYLLPLLCLIAAAVLASQLTASLALSELWVLPALVGGGYGGFRWAGYLAGRLVAEPKLIKVLSRERDRMELAVTGG
ncbi:SoxR reducing system RseC family protein [Gallaecimonas pentaromativorans]|uniref:RseC/MucC-like positive regulator of sigma(E) n=1 Tax=Gallaecimonas pentaromativorans TaxID=584787 RepID=A0A3N1PNL1_9GAMM|nr:SoxR reducing system RseC family protein [Gallaecimonas pentaromativorans]ROQ30325.1 RseC/MucC-like positive regulator of sigma(E) [Gallaecimonas pentaromativorans]